MTTTELGDPGYQSQGGSVDGMVKLPLVGYTEIAQRAGVQRHTVTTWRDRYKDFPEPVEELATGPIWSWPDVRDRDGVPYHVRTSGGGDMNPNHPTALVDLGLDKPVPVDEEVEFLRDDQ